MMPWPHPWPLLRIVSRQQRVSDDVDVDDDYDYDCGTEVDCVVWGH